MIPPICNEFVMVLKDTSLVSIIALTDLTYQTKIIASNKASALVYIPATDHLPHHHRRVHRYFSIALKSACPSTNKEEYGYVYH